MDLWFCVTRHKTTTTIPRAMIERFYRSLKAFLLAQLPDPDWMAHLSWVLLRLRTCPKKDSAFFPAEEAFAQNSMLPWLSIAPRDQNSSLRTIPYGTMGVCLLRIPSQCVQPVTYFSGGGMLIGHQFKDPTRILSQWLVKTIKHALFYAVLCYKNHCHDLPGDLVSFSEIMN